MNLKLELMLETVYVLYRACQNAPHEETYLLKNVSKISHFSNTLQMFSLISSPSYAFYSITFDHPIPEIWSI